jgi:hypothetical protein
MPVWLSPLPAPLRYGPVHRKRDAHCNAGEHGAHAADASDNGPRHPARYGQNDPEIATTRKNALFAGADSGARSWAIFTSLIQSARMNGLNPFEYLKDVLERIVSADVKAHQLDCLLPWTWKPQQSGRQTVQAA